MGAFFLPSYSFVLILLKEAPFPLLHPHKEKGKETFF
jgi:hypothetical protein